METKILYKCDHHACESCNCDGCEYTSDITHAVNFKKVGEDFVEDSSTNDKYKVLSLKDYCAKIGVECVNEDLFDGCALRYVKQNNEKLNKRCEND